MWLVTVTVGNTTGTAFLWNREQADDVWQQPLQLLTASTEELRTYYCPTRQSEFDPKSGPSFPRELICKLCFGITQKQRTTSLSPKPNDNYLEASIEYQTGLEILKEYNVDILLSGSVPDVIRGLEKELTDIPWSFGKIYLFVNQKDSEAKKIDNEKDNEQTQQREQILTSKNDDESSATATDSQNTSQYKLETILLDSGLEIVPDPPSRVGKDRLAAALGALRLCADCAWVVVDSGTAITVNAVLPSPFVSQSFRSLQDKTTEKERKGPIGVFEGGLILPGEGLGLRSLSQGTAQLPRLPYWPAESEVPTIGRSTEEAIRAGTRQLILHGVLGIIKAQIKDIQTVMGDKGCHGRITTAISDEVRVVITGGGAKVIWPEVENELACNKPAWDPYLVHRGLYMAWLHQTQE